MTRPRGKLILVVGPSGSGKDTLIAHIRALHPEIVFPVSCTTRAPRPHEVEGRDYYFVTEDEFKRRVARGYFVEWAQYGGHLYGSPKEEIQRPLDEEKLILDEVEVQGARQIKSKIPPEDLMIVFINAGSWAELEERIRARAPISEEELAKRKSRYEEEMQFAKEADVIVKNPAGKVEEAKREFARVVESFLVS